VHKTYTNRISHMREKDTIRIRIVHKLLLAL